MKQIGLQIYKSRFLLFLFNLIIIAVQLYKKQSDSFLISKKLYIFYAFFLIARQLV